MVGVTDDLMLDPKIRNWVLFPILVIMFLVQMGRSYAQMLLKDDKAAEPDTLAHMQLLTRSQRVRSNNRLLTPAAFHMRKTYLVGTKGKVLRQKLEGGAPNPMQNPDGMMSMMKGNMTMMLPNIVMMSGISYFFSGFVMAKAPFMLTEGFKQMLQRDVALTTLETSYVSSLSWYFLALFGLRGFFSLVLGDQAMAEDARMMQQQMGMGMGGNPMQFDPKKAYKQEKAALNFVEHKCLVRIAEDDFLKT